MIKTFYRSITVSLGLLICWYGITWYTQIPAYILPSPFTVFNTLYQEKILLSQHLLPTIIETLGGLTLGILLGSLSAFSILFFKPLRAWFLPLLIISQAIPVFAIAPLLVIWLGYGMASKIATAAIMIFFPIASTFYDGLKQVNKHWLDLTKTMNANAWRTFLHIRLPAALPHFASGIRIAAAIAPIGAVIGEWVGASQGIGYLMMNANSRLQIDMMFAALILIILLSLTLYFAIDKLLKYYIWW